MTSKRIGPVGALLGLTLGIAQPTWAQNGDPREFRACFVPTVGAMYLIGETGLPESCLSEAHEEIQWVENGDGTVTILDGSVTTPKLADDAVTAEKIASAAVQTDGVADEAITAAKLADGAVGSDQLADGAVTAEKIAQGAIVVTDIAPDAVGDEEIRSNAVGSDELKPSSVTSEHLNVRWARTTSSTMVPANDDATFERSCTDGREVLAGGWLAETGMRVIQSGANSNSTWLFSFINETPNPVNVQLVVMCADIQ